MRLKVLSGIILISFLYLILGLGYLQIVKGPLYQGLSESNRIRLIPLTARRGTIYDRRGVVLADMRPSFNISIIPQEFKDETIERLTEILGVGPHKIRARLFKGRSLPFAPVVVANDIDRTKVTIIEERISQLPGVIVQVEGIRSYPHRETSSHVLGYLGRINPAELKEKKRYGYQIRDLVGRSGVEKVFDRWLKGKDGGRQVEVDYRGYTKQVLGQKYPRSGKDLWLTIDMRLQELARDLLGQRQGVLIVMEPFSGEILAMISRPGYDPNLFVDPQKSRMRRGVLSDRSSPMLNRAISGQYPTGSVFKIVTALTALDSGKITRSTHRRCDGIYYVGDRGFKCWYEDGHGNLDLEEAIAYSCNVFFYQIGLMAGVEDLARMAKYLEFGKATGVDLPNEACGFVPTSRWKRQELGEPWYEGETANFSIGQGYFTATPLQVARMVSAIANGGTLVQPYLVSTKAAKKSRKLDILAKDIELVKSAMSKVVGWEGGTGRLAYSPDVAVAGKTGTAEVRKGKSHAWFVGFAPVDKPEIAFCIFVEHGGYGSLIPAQIAGELISTWSRMREEDLDRAEEIIDESKAVERIRL